MSDYLKELCLQNKLKLVYSDNDYTILSVRVRNNTPILKAYNKFQNCPQNIAAAILRYYTTNHKKYLNVIEDFIEDDLFFLGYDIEPPDEMFLSLVNNPGNFKMHQPSPTKDKSPDYREMEMDILSITKKDFYGDILKIRPNQPIKSPSESVAELDIIVNKD